MKSKGHNTANDNLPLRQCIDILHQSNMTAIDKLIEIGGTDALKLSEAKYHYMVAYEMTMEAISNVAI